LSLAARRIVLRESWPGGNPGPASTTAPLGIEVDMVNLLFINSEVLFWGETRWR
jgi:hypothetical protein